MVEFVNGKFPLKQLITVGNKTSSQQLRMSQSTAHKILHNVLRYKSPRVTDMWGKNNLQELT